MEGGIIVQVFRTIDFELVAKLNKPVHDLHHQLYPTYFKKYDYESMKEFFKSVIGNPNFIFLVIEDEHQHLGYVWIEMRTYQETAFRQQYQSIYVHQISITQTNRKQGYGTKLMEEVYKIGRENSIDLFELDYWSNNPNARKFYQKHGFEMYREFVFKNI
jgi:ribosomal protein S18 acetylase RimI-like enzyme